MDRLNAMRVFVQVVDRGSQSAAADALALSRPAVSRYLAELEEWVGARLLHRTTRRLSLTPAGAEVLTRCRQMLELEGDMRAAVASPDNTPRGVLRVTARTSFGQTHLASAIVDYTRAYPDVAVDMVMVDRTVNLVDERIDLALRVANELDPNLIARRLAVCRSVLCASPDYLRRQGGPGRLEDLALHNCLTHSCTGKSLWHFVRAGEPVSVAVSGNISSNEVAALVEAAVCGAGVAMLPTYALPGLVGAERLRVLLPEFPPREMALYGVYASRKHMPLTLRTLLDFLAQRFSDPPSWDVELDRILAEQAAGGREVRRAAKTVTSSPS
ncbi:MAG: LysR family transcriptional regulator [Pigmentiphaga sp.]|uniref:LysR family transcriptional regulator n=1 Tax=Pigmentiphaga sp. TaxID=1977564 RepID=UPI0029B09739|nr:LysR family transcriptional regulator [Pigmentiphaga sp.]MDX3905048.1 LysR family transcriptional regulator [Pigmentiphaga sp.]